MTHLHTSLTRCSLVPSAIKSWGVESGNEANLLHIHPHLYSFAVLTLGSVVTCLIVVNIDHYTNKVT